MTQLELSRRLMAVLRVLLPLSSRRCRYMVAGDLADLLLAATWPVRNPRLWWFYRRVLRAAAQGQTIIEA